MPTCQQAGIQQVRCCDGQVCLVRWSDDNVVTCACNFDRVHPVVMVECREKGAHSKSKGSQPRMIANYTAGMGGVDLCDRLVSAYRPRIKGKKMVVEPFRKWNKYCDFRSLESSL